MGLTRIYWKAELPLGQSFPPTGVHMTHNTQHKQQNHSGRCNERGCRDVMEGGSDEQKKMIVQMGKGLRVHVEGRVMERRDN